MHFADSGSKTSKYLAINPIGKISPLKTAD
jgi:hypothetical protein